MAKTDAERERERERQTERGRVKFVCSVERFIMPGIEAHFEKVSVSFFRLPALAF